MNWILLGLAMLLAMRSRPSSSSSSEPVSEKAREMRDLIRARARAWGVPEKLALAVARAESNFNPNAEGDLEWHMDRARYQRVVPTGSPYFSMPQLWHSYGLFQLLAPYHVDRTENPRILLDPATNTDRALKTLRNLVAKYGDDWDSVRLAYAGAAGLNHDIQQRILDRWHTMLKLEG